MSFSKDIYLNLYFLVQNLLLIYSKKILYFLSYVRFFYIYYLLSIHSVPQITVSVSLEGSWGLNFPPDNTLLIVTSDKWIRLMSITQYTVINPSIITNELTKDYLYYRDALLLLKGTGLLWPFSNYIDLR